MNFKEKITKFITKNKIKILIAIIALICSIAIAIGVYAQVAHKKLIRWKR